MSQVSCRMKTGVWFPSTIQPSALETFALETFIYALLQLRIMHLSLPLLVSFLALFEHVVRLPSQCSKTAVRCELYVIKIWCRLGKFRDAAHPHVLIICCCGITWASGFLVLVVEELVLTLSRAHGSLYHVRS